MLQLQPLSKIRDHTQGKQYSSKYPSMYDLNLSKWHVTAHHLGHHVLLEKLKMAPLRAGLYP